MLGHFEEDDLRNIAFIVIDDAEVVAMLARSSEPHCDGRHNSQMMGQLFRGMIGVYAFVRNGKLTLRRVKL